MAKDSLTNFANILYAEATDEKARAEERFLAEREETLLKHQKNLEKRFNQELAACTRRAEEEKFLAVSRWEVELLTKLRHIRNEAFCEVINEVENRLRDFADGDKYAEYIKSLVREAEMFNSSGTVCIAREMDVAILKKEFSAQDIEFESTNEDIIGGFIIKNAKLGLYADYTLRSGLCEKQELFFEISGLAID